MSDYIIHKNIFWKRYQGALIPENPPHTPISVSDQDKNILLDKSRSYFIRWSTHWDYEQPTEWWYVIKDMFGGMNELSSNTRSKLRRALKRNYVKKANMDEILTAGYDVYLAAFNTYKTYLSPVTKSDYINSLNNLDQNMWEFFAVFTKTENKLVAYSQNLVLDNAVDYKIIKLHPDYLKDYPAYALIYEMNRYYLDERKMNYVTDGSRSIAHDSNIQNFLEDKFKFRKAYCMLNIKYSKILYLIIKILFPFRLMFKFINIGIGRKLNILLWQEDIRRKSVIE